MTEILACIMQCKWRNYHPSLHQATEFLPSNRLGMLGYISKFLGSKKIVCGLRLGKEIIRSTNTVSVFMQHRAAYAVTESDLNNYTIEIIGKLSY